MIRRLRLRLGRWILPKAKPANIDVGERGPELIAARWAAIYRDSRRVGKALIRDGALRDSKVVRREDDQ